MIDAGDWTGPGGAAIVLRRTDVDVAVLETARGGLVLRGMGYESNEASVFTNVSSDHLDLQGIHTLAELAEVKSTVCRVTKPDGWVVLNADDPLVATVARRVRARVAWFSLDPESSPVLARHRRAGGIRAYVLRRGLLVEWDGDEEHEIVAAADLPVALGGLARHNIANALAAAGGARAMGMSIAQVADGLRDFRPSAELSPGRMNLFRLGQRTVIVDFAHNEAGHRGDPRRRRGHRRGCGGPGGAGHGDHRHRGRSARRHAAGHRADRRAQGAAGRRSRRRSGTCAGGTARRSSRRSGPGSRRAASTRRPCPSTRPRPAALEAELSGSSGAASTNGRADAPRVVVLFCHAEREDVFALLERLGARQVDAADGLRDLSPRLADQRRS